MYAVHLEDRAEKDLDSLSSDLHGRVVDKILALKEQPRPPGCKKLKGSICNWRIRIGTYRVLYEIDDKGRSIRVYRIKHRKEAYR